MTFRETRVRRQESGMTLLETMVAVTLLGVVGLAFYQTYNESQRHLAKGQAVMEMQQNARVALETIAAELRNAHGIEVMESDRVVFTSDVFTNDQSRTLQLDEGDQDLDGAHDELVVSRTPTDAGAAGTQSDEIAETIHNVAFRYLNSMSGSSEAQSPEQVRRIEVTVTGRLALESSDTTEISFQTTVKPRNLRLPEPPTPDSDAPQAPSNLYLSPTCGVLDMTWDANSEDDLAGYRVYYDTDSSGEPYDGSGATQGSSPAYAGNVTSFQLTGLSPSETYYVAVTAIDVSANESGYSIERVAVPGEADPPSAPTGLAVDAGGEQILVLAWNPNPEPDVVLYRLYYDLDGSGAPYAEADSSYSANIRLEGLMAGTMYYLVVTAVDGCGNESPYSEEVSGVPRPCSDDPVPPAAPQGLEGIAGDGAAVLIWSPNSEPDLDSYRIRYSWASGADSVDIGITARYELSGLANGTDYTFRVVAIDACGNLSNESVAVVVRPLSCAGDDTPPATPSFLVVEDIRAEAGDELLVTWAPNTETDLAGYWLYYGSAPRSYGDPIDVGSQAFYLLTGLIPEQVYFISVVASDRCGNTSAYSYEENATPTLGCICNPSVSLTTPPGGSILDDAVPVSINVVPCPDQVILKVEFRVDGYPERTWYNAPYSFVWDSSRWPDGQYELAAVATDNEGCAGGDTIHVTLSNSGTGPGCVRVDITNPVDVSGIFDQEVNFGIRNTSAVRSCGMTALKTEWTTQNPEMSVARLHRVEIPPGSTVWDAGPVVEDAAASGELVALTSPVTLVGGASEDVLLSFWHEDGDLNPGGRENVAMLGILVKTQAEVAPDWLCAADSFLTSCTIALENLTASSGRTYEQAYLDVGDDYYTDRNYVIQGIPSGFEGLLWIKTPNGDKSQGGDFTLEFDVDSRVTLYIAYDPRDTAPAWMTDSYTPTGLSIDVSDVGVDVLNLWARDFPEGHITLYGNRAPGSGFRVKTNYVVLLDCR